MTPTIQLASERTIIAQTLISILTNIRETYLPDLGAADAYELLLTGAHVLLAQTTRRPATSARRTRRNSSSVFPANIGPQTTSIRPVLAMAPLWLARPGG